MALVAQLLRERCKLSGQAAVVILTPSDRNRLSVAESKIQKNHAYRDS